MNQFTRAVILEFMGPINKQYLYRRLMAHFMDDRVVSYLNDHLVDNIRHFSQRIDQEMSVSDPLHGITMVDQVMT